MAEENGDGETPKAKTVDELLKECNGDREALRELLYPLFKDMWTESLRVLEELFPHSKGDRSRNDAIFQAAKFRILNKGNGLVRQLPMLLSDFYVAQMRECVITTHLVKGEGPFNLPAGVKMPSDRVQKQS